MLICQQHYFFWTCILREASADYFKQSKHSANWQTFPYHSQWHYVHTIHRRERKHIKMVPMKATTKESRVILKHTSATWLHPAAAAFTKNTQAVIFPWCTLSAQHSTARGFKSPPTPFSGTASTPPYMKVRRTGEVMEAFNICNTSTNTWAAASAL